jgi:thiopeptide-type bacteriocin biosynthesis protein
MDENRWLYQKLFISPNLLDTAPDHVLVYHVASLSEALLGQGWIDRFFYLRYAEAGFHIRYRVRLTGTAEATTVQAYLQEAAESFDGIVRAEQATYEPETDKYGGPDGIEICERLFDSSSRLALACIERTLGHPDLRLIVAVFAFDALLSAGDVKAAARDAILADYARYWKSLSWGQHHGPADASEPSERLLAALADQLIASGGRQDLVAHLVGRGLDQWVSDLRSHMSELDALWRDGKLTTHRSIILCNLAHMMNNRLGISPPDEALIASLLREADGFRAQDADMRNARSNDA